MKITNNKENLVYTTNKRIRYLQNTISILEYLKLEQDTQAQERDSIQLTLDFLRGLLNKDYQMLKDLSK